MREFLVSISDEAANPTYLFIVNHYLPTAYHQVHSNSETYLKHIKLQQKKKKSSIIGL